MEQEIENLKRQLLQLQNTLTNQAPAQTVVQQNTVPSPETFSFIKEEWEAWVQHYERFRVAAKIDVTDQKTQINNLLLFMGPKITKLFETNQKKEADFASYKELKEFLDKQFTGKRNIIYMRAKFNSRVQKDGELAEAYIGELISMAKNCDFKSLENELIRDRLVVGIRDIKLSETLQMDESLTLEKAIDKIKQSEQIKEENRELRRNPEVVNRVTQQNNSTRWERKNRNETKEERQKETNAPSNQCYKCGKRPSHPKNKCPANKVRCRKCKIVGHFAAQCRTKRFSEVVDEGSSSSEESGEEIGEIINISRIKENDPWKVKLKVGNAKIQFKLDTGADETVLSRNDYERKLQNMFHLEETKVKLVGPGTGESSELKVFGQVKIPVTMHGCIKEIKCYVVDTKENLLGRPALTELDLVTWKNKKLIRHVNEAVENANRASTTNNFQSKSKGSMEKQIAELYPELFSGLGKLKNFRHKICLSENAIPYACVTPRRVPLPLQRKVEDELKRMVRDGVIEEIEEATEWCSPMVVVPKKDDGVRVCSDYTELNKFVVRERYQLPSVEETLARLEDAKVFTKLDFNSGFWQLSLDKRSRKYTTFLTPFGRFAYKRVPFGITSAPELFQKTVNDVIKTLNMDSVLVHADDILVTGRNVMEHDRNLHKVLKLLRDFGLTLNAKKCEFKKTETPYLGYIVSAEGIKVDPKSTEAIVQYPAPRNKTEIRKFLGFVNYVSKFVKNLATKTQSIRELLRNDSQFAWTEKHQQDFDHLKSEIASYPVLAKFSTSRKTRVSADASQYGLGGVLEQLQDDECWRPVYYCSKTLSDSEKRYAQIEKEALAVTWACERLEQFLLGSKFEILTDHKPLIVVLASKEINKLSNRLQRFRMRLLKFNYTINYVPGKTFYIPDALSRAPLSDGNKDGDVIHCDSEVYINAVVSEVSKEMLSSQRIYEEQILDKQIDQIKQYIIDGWPDKKKLENETQEYYKFRQELTFNNNLLCYGDRLVIPRSLRKLCLVRIHDGHFGVNRCIARAKETVWWPSISRQIEELVSSCEICLRNRSNFVEPMLPSDVPTRPWSIIGADLAEHQGKTYLVVQDYYSKFPEIEKVNRITSEEIIRKLKGIFSRHGIPDVLRSDNGSQFSSCEFKQFSRSYGFKWVSSSPEYQQSNGQAESAVKLLKRILKKNPEDIDLALLSYRNTVRNCGASPAQLLYGRSLKDRIPIIEKKLKPRLPNHSRIRERMQVEKEKQKSNYDNRHRVQERKEPRIGDRVWIINMQKEGRIDHKTDQPRSYMVNTEDGGTVRRNSRHLQPLPEAAKESATTTIPVEEPVTRPIRERKTPSYLKDFVCHY